MRLSASFLLSEFVYSDTATRLGIDNTPSDYEIDNLRDLCLFVLQPLRNKLDKPIQITSGFRCLDLNRALNSKDSSQHIKGQAADIVIYGYNTLKLAEYIRDNSIFDQLILEYHNEKDPTSGWVHVSYNSFGNRMECLTINDYGVFKGINGQEATKDEPEVEPEIKVEVETEDMEPKWWYAIKRFFSRFRL